MSSRYVLTKPCPESDPGPNVYVFKNWDLPRVMYRTFSEKQFADDFCRGRIRISTLSACRADAHPTRGDAGEGTSRYTIPYIEGTEGNPALQRLRSMQTPFDLVNCVGGGMVNCSVNERIGDAWVLCFTELANNPGTEDLGAFEVQVQHPRAFCATLTYAIAQLARIQPAQIGPALYVGRQHNFPELRLPTAFLKPPDKYEQQREVRMVWYPQQHDGRQLEAIFLDLPWLSEACKPLYR